jgi:PAS domain S-box-containing protein
LSQGQPALADETDVEATPIDERSSDLYRLLVSSALDYAIFALDPTGKVLSWNLGAERIKGYAADEIIGRHFSTFYPREAVESGFPDYELEVAGQVGRFEDEGWRIRKGGSRFWANVVITALRDADGRLIGFAKVTRDLTARREAEEQARKLAAEEAAHAEATRRSEELERLNERLREQAAELEAQTRESQSLAARIQQANQDLQAALAEARASSAAAERAAAAATEAYRDLDRFAYVASHDLKAPLRGIASLAQWIQEDAYEVLGDESKEHLRLLQGRAQRMAALIDGILAYSRAGRALNPPEMVDTGALIREVVELLAVQPEVTIRLPDHMPTLQAERIPMQQVFLNLLGNAVKFAGSVRPDALITVAWRDLGDAYEYAVTDNGPGIAPQYHERIWEIFQRLTSRDKVEGTGIGLSVVKKIVESRGGTVALESVPGEGATFRLTWPKQAPQSVVG